MRVDVFDDLTIIGTAVLDRLDPPMGVASGIFTPSSEYQRGRHARMIDGALSQDFTARLNARADGRGQVERVRIEIEDWSEIAGEIQLWAYFESGLDYDPIFSEYDDYKAYSAPKS